VLVYDDKEYRIKESHNLKLGAATIELIDLAVPFQ
jgi:hypothetical protein